jgi:sorbitol-specific phosphotransferase system component IIC
MILTAIHKNQKIHALSLNYLRYVVAHYYLSCKEESTLIYCDRVITAFGRLMKEKISPSGKQAIPTPPNI